MHEPTDRVQRAERSRIRVMYDLAESVDRDLVRLEVGEPDFDTPDHVVDAAAEAARGGATHYTTNAGMPACRRAIRDAMAADYGVEHGIDEIVVTVGGMEALHLATLATVGPGEELLYPGPAWPNYETQAFLADGRGVEVPMAADAGFALEADRLAARMGPETAAVVLTTPSNPTGRVFDPDEIRAVVEAAAEAAGDGATHYTSNAGLPACRRAIRDAMAADYGVEHGVDEIVVTVGGMEALHLATLATTISSTPCSTP